MHAEQHMSIIDLSTFEKLKDDVGADFVDELIAAYCAETPLLMAKLQSALMAHDADAFRQAAHSIKSTSKTFGAFSLGQIAKALEMMGRAGNLDDAQEKIDRLAAEYDRVQQALKDLAHG
jgi:HPt (histidine-containing phosphotransfer) domain-containing protein